MEEYRGYVGLDVHKDTIAVAVAYPGRSKPESLGVIANTKKSILNPVASSRRDETGGAAAETACEYSPSGYGKRYTAGKSKWTQGYYRWLAEVKIAGSAPSSRKARQG